MRRRSGFTLIEVIVALAVSGIVLLGARALLAATADNASHILSAAAASDRDANAERTLRAYFDRLEVGTVAGTDFGGDASSVRFGSWCDVAGGWQERCAVTIAIEADGKGSVLVARTSLGDALSLRTGFHAGSLRYLNTPASGGVWMNTWGSGITAPVAVEIILERDTLIVRIGERG